MTQSLLGAEDVDEHRFRPVVNLEYVSFIILLLLIYLQKYFLQEYVLVPLQSRFAKHNAYAGLNICF